MRYFCIGLVLFLGIEWAVAAVNKPSEIVLIRDDDVVVTQADFQAELATIPEKFRARIKADSQQIIKLLDKIFVYRVLAKEARELGLDKDPVLRRKIKLKMEGVLGRARLEQLREQALAKNPDFEALARERYRVNKEKYRLPEQVKVSHILIKPEKGNEQKARELAEKVRQLALAGEQSFSELALKYSDAPSVEQNKGHLGLISRKKTVKPFEEAAFALQNPGDISPVVKTRYGFHIIRLEKRQPAHQESFKEVRDKLVQQVKEAYLNNVVRTHLSEIRNAEGIKMNQEAIRNLEKDLTDINPKFSSQGVGRDQSPD